MTKSQLEVVNAAAIHASRVAAAAPAPTPKQSRVKLEALKGAALGAMGGAYIGSEIVHKLDAGRPENEKLTSAEKLKLILSNTLSSAAGASVAFANDQRGIESASERGVDKPNFAWRMAKKAATAALVNVATAKAIDAATGASQPYAEHIQRKINEQDRLAEKKTQFGARRASHTARADAHERRARSARSGRSALLHSERAAELRALCVRSVRQTTP